MTIQAFYMHVLMAQIYTASDAFINPDYNVYPTVIFLKRKEYLYNFSRFIIILKKTRTISVSLGKGIYLW